MSDDFTKDYLRTHRPYKPLTQAAEPASVIGAAISATVKPWSILPAPRRLIPEAVMMLAAVALLVAMLLPNTGRAQDAPAAGCTLAIEGSGSSSVFINASGCTGDTIAIIAAAGRKQQQFPPMPGPEIYQPWNIQPCDLGLDTDQPVPLSYTAVVVSGPDKGKTSAPYTGTLEPSRPPDDAPPSISFSGTPTTGTFVRTGDTIALTVTAEDDAGLTSLKVTDPNGQVILDKRIAPVHTAQNKCHSHPEGQRETVTLPKIVVPQDPPTPVIRFTAVARDTAGQDGPSIRPALARDGTVYAAYFGWRSFDGSVATSDVVVMRDEAAATTFQALRGADGLPGRFVAQRVKIPWANAPTLGQERIGSTLSIAVDPNHSSTVYVAWGDRVGTGDIYTIHVRRSTDRGVSWSTDLRALTNATNAALAVANNGTVGLLYQQVAGSGAHSRWETRLEQTRDGFTTVQTAVLATVPADAPAVQFLPYIGDYNYVLAAGDEFRGVFAANNTPDPANFPHGVTFQRRINTTTKTLEDASGQSVASSIDPFYFSVAVMR